MAQFGAKRPRFAPVADTPAGAIPTYDAEKVVTIGKLVKADLSVGFRKRYGKHDLAAAFVGDVEREVSAVGRYDEQFAASDAEDTELPFPAETPCRSDHTQSPM